MMNLENSIRFAADICFLPIKPVAEADAIMDRLLYNEILVET